MSQPQAEVIVGECIVKCAQCVLSSRVLEQGPRGPPDRKRSRWVSSQQLGPTSGARCSCSSIQRLQV